MGRGAILDLGGMPGRAVNGAFAINNQGQVVGFSRLTATSPVDPWIWHKGKVTPLPKLPGAVDGLDNKSFRLTPSQPLARTIHRARIVGTAKATGDGGAEMTLDGNFNRVVQGAGADDFVWNFRFAPQNDLFEDALPITGIEGSVNNSTVNATG